MRSSDPEAYDQFKELSDNQTLSDGFRGLLLVADTTTSPGAEAQVSVTQITNGSAVSKVIRMRAPINESFYLPISGETVNVKLSAITHKFYVLI